MPKIRLNNLAVIKNNNIGLENEMKKKQLVIWMIMMWIRIIKIMHIKILLKKKL